MIKGERGDKEKMFARVLEENWLFFATPTSRGDSVVTGEEGFTTIGA